MPGTRKLGKTTDQRSAMLRQQVTDFLDKGKMETTVTRAKEMVILIGNKKTFQYMVRNKRTERRYTALVRFIKELM